MVQYGGGRYPPWDICDPSFAWLVLVLLMCLCVVFLQGLSLYWRGEAGQEGVCRRLVGWYDVKIFEGACGERDNHTYLPTILLCGVLRFWQPDHLFVASLHLWWGKTVSDTLTSQKSSKIHFETRVGWAWNIFDGFRLRRHDRACRKKKSFSKVDVELWKVDVELFSSAVRIWVLSGKPPPFTVQWVWYISIKTSDENFRKFRFKMYTKMYTSWHFSFFKQKSDNWNIKGHSQVGRPMYRSDHVFTLRWRSLGEYHTHSYYFTKSCSTRITMVY